MLLVLSLNEVCSLASTSSFLEYDFSPYTLRHIINMARPVQRLASVRVLATATPQDIRSNAGMPLLNMLDRIQAQESVVCIHLRKGSPHLEDDTTDNVLSDALKIDPLCRYADAGFEILDVYHGPEWRKRPDKGGKGQYWNPQGMNTPLCAEMRLSPLQDRWEEWGPRAAVDDEGDLLVQQGQDGQEYALMIHSWGGHLLVLARLPQAVDPDRESGPRKFCALCCKTIPVAWFNQPCHFHPGT